MQSNLILQVLVTGGTGSLTGAGWWTCRSGARGSEAQPGAFAAAGVVRGDASGYGRGLAGDGLKRRATYMNTLRLEPHQDSPD